MPWQGPFDAVGSKAEALDPEALPPAQECPNTMTVIDRLSMGEPQGEVSAASKCSSAEGPLRVGQQELGQGPLLVESPGCQRGRH